jgi:serine/threonine protein kinase
LVVTSLGAIYLGTELIRTGDLLDYLEVSTRQHPDYAYGFWDAKLCILKKMLYIGKRLEKCNMIHRDLSLENFLLGNGLDKLFVIDFGLSRSADNYIKHTPCGKPGYIAPEVQFPAPEGYKPFCIDAYALGVCFFYIVFGFAPYERIGDSLFCTLDEHGLSGLYAVLGIDTTKVPRVFLRLLDGLIRKHETRYSMQMCAEVLRTEQLPG